jgi:LPS-assembly lipoprotein
MWWCKRLAAAAACLVLAGCGFHPLYSDGSMNGDLAKQMAAIQVMQISEHYGQVMTNNLSDGLNPHSLRVPATYKLEVALREGTYQYATRADGTPSRSALQLSATWLLRRISDNQIVTKGSVKASNGYDVLPNDYANVVTGNTDELRAVHDLSDQIQLSVADYLTGQSKT